MRKGIAVCMALALLAAACGDGAGDGPTGRVAIDGSSTVFPVTEAVADEFARAGGRGVRVTVGTSGTGGGFSRFCSGETDISNASRPIQPSERERCEASGVEPIELPVAYDGLSVLVNPQNDFVECMTVGELRRVWEPGSAVERWSDVRPDWPDRPMRLYGPGTNSGTFDYFTEAIMGEEDASRADYTASEDDNVLVQGIAGDADALGYFGYAYYSENADRLQAVAVDGGDGCVAPSPETIASGEYQPLSRPLMIYVSAASLQRPAVREFVGFYLDAAPELVPQVGYVALEAERYAEARQRVQAAVSD